MELSQLRHAGPAQLQRPRSPSGARGRVAIGSWPAVVHFCAPGFRDDGREPILTRLTALASLNVDVIVSGSNLVTRAAKDATTSTPIVMVANVTPVEHGLVASLAHPGGNVTPGLPYGCGTEPVGQGALVQRLK
jgi:hypothetical protein